MSRIGKAGTGSTSLGKNTGIGTSPAKKGQGSKIEKADKVHSSFIDAVNQAEMSFSRDELEKSLEDIDRLGKELVRNPTLRLFEEYKRKVSAYLKEVLRKIYKVETKEGLPRYGGGKKAYLNIVQIDEEMEKLTMKFIRNQADAVGIISDVEGIKGLLYSITA